MEKNYDWKKELFQIIKNLQDNGVDITSIPTTKNRAYTVLKDIRQEGIDIETIIKDNQLDGNYRIGRKLNYFRMLYKGTIKGQMSDEERMLAEKLGIVEKIPSGRQKTIFKGRKISQFHIDFINEHFSKILSGELNTRETLKLLKKACIAENETVIDDVGSIKRMVYSLLKDKPEELEKYRQIVKGNSGKRSNKITITNGYELGEYNTEVQKFKKVLIDVYLPQYINGEITLDTIVKELKISHKSVDQIVEEHYINNGDNEGLELYEKRKKDNRGQSKEKREAAKKMREEVAEYEIVSNAEFLLLSEEEQDEQIIMKIRQSKLQEEKRGINTTRLITEETTIASIERIKQYFRNKNDSCKEYFSEQDIRHMIFIFPTLIGRSNEILEEKFATLTYFEEIDEQTAYGMVKSFPAIAGYSVERIKSQLDLLQKENLIDAVISKPRRMMQSVELMYALIQYAKERHKTSDLTDVNRSNIFMGNSTIKRAYGETYEELKKRFPYDKKRSEEDTVYIVSGQDIGKATYKEVTVTQAEEASKVVEEMLMTRDTKEVK